MAPLRRSDGEAEPAPGAQQGAEAGQDEPGEDECGDAESELPKGLRLVPVTTLKSAVNSLVALEKGKGSVPSC